MGNTDESGGQGNDAKFAAVEARMDARLDEMQRQIDRRFKGMHDALDENRDRVKEVDARTQRIEQDTGKLVGIFSGTQRSASYFAGLAKFLRRAAIFVGPFITIGGFIWAIVHGKPPAGG